MLSFGHHPGAGGTTSLTRPNKRESTMAQPSTPTVRVRTPATSANLGPGFDSLGLALELYDEVEVEVVDDESGLVEIVIEGEAADELPRDGRHLVVRAMWKTYQTVGAPVPGLRLHCRNGVPNGRGLGSSASAIVAGVTAAAALIRDDPTGRNLDRDKVYRLAAKIEGHPDNVAPCVYGGFTTAWCTEHRWRAISRPVSPEIVPVLCVSEEPLSTERARGLLPEEVPHRAASFTAGRAALLAQALTDSPELLLEATEERLHQNYREPAIPESLALVRKLRSTGLAAVVSGAGPSVLVLGRVEGGADDLDSPEITALVDSVRRQAGRHWHIRPLRIDANGVCVSPQS